VVVPVVTDSAEICHIKCISITFTISVKNEKFSLSKREGGYLLLDSIVLCVGISVKVKVHPIIGHEIPQKYRIYSCTISLISALGVG
jgi:hypothetical protein